MALRIRKDIKKSSYYVWFLGAKESKGIRGSEYILPVIEHLVLREKEVEPFKVTLQISHKGLKIIQNVLSTNPKTSKPKNEIIKHFIPHNTITCVYQNEDVVSCILLLYNPVTKCPLHVHVYRCDSNETATMLKKQLEVLIERPENQKKYSDLENRFVKPEKKKFESSVGSDTGTSTRESESSEERYPPTTLYDSLAAELRQKLRKNTPILLPPRDYDTVHRQRGNFHGIDTRRCLTASVVGGGPGGAPGGHPHGSIPGGHPHGSIPGGLLQGSGPGGLLQGSGPGGLLQGTTTPGGLLQGNGGISLTRRMESSGGSSGIGSDHAPSPESEGGNYLMDNQSTSDEEWNTEQSDSTLYLMHGDMLLPRASRHPDPSKFSPEPPKSPVYQDRAPRYPEEKFYDKGSKESQRHVESSNKRYEQFERHGNPRYAVSDHPKDRYEHNGQPRYAEKERVFSSNKYDERYLEQQRHRNPRYQEEVEDVEYREKRSGKPAKEDPRRDRYYIEERNQEKIRPKYNKDLQDRYYQEYEDYQHNKQYYEQTKTLEKSPKRAIQEYQPRSKYSEEIPRSSKYPEDHSRSSKYAEDFFDDLTDSRRRPEDRQRSPTPPEQNVSPKDRFKDAKEKFLLLERERHEDERLRRQEMCSSVPNLKDKTFLKRHDSMMHAKERSSKYAEDFFDDLTDSRRRPEDRQRSPTPPEQNVSPKDRFKDAKEKFLLLERERHEDERLRRQEMCSSVPNLKDKTFLKRHDSMMHAKERYQDERRYEDTRYQPKPAPRTILEDDRYRRDRYRSPDRYEKTRRTVLNQIEEDHKQKSNEIAKELKRRSYLETSNYEKDFYRDDYDKKYTDRDLYQFSKSNIELDKISQEMKFSKSPKKTPAGYRHSYAEPKFSKDKVTKSVYPGDIVHRTSSSVGNNSGRVGLASVNPY